MNLGSMFIVMEVESPPFGFLVLSFQITDYEVSACLSRGDKEII